VRVAVVGHIEWIDFVSVDRVPLAGEIIHARDSWAEPAGGGAVTVVQLARLAGHASFFTALGNDHLGEQARKRLAELDVTVHAERRPEPTRRGFTFLDAAGERTITTLGARLLPLGSDPLPWSEFAAIDAVYVTAGDAEALEHARAARVVVATPRVGSALGTLAVDAVVYSAGDQLERETVAAMGSQPALVVATEGAAGGSWRTADGRSGRWTVAAPPGPLVDLYGAGDSFAGGLTFGLGAGRSVEHAIELAAKCGAWCASGRGPYSGQLRTP
jgi:ribokinase